MSFLLIVQKNGSKLTTLFLLQLKHIVAFPPEQGSNASVEEARLKLAFMEALEPYLVDSSNAPWLRRVVLMWSLSKWKRWNTLLCVALSIPDTLRSIHLRDRFYRDNTRTSSIHAKHSIILICHKYDNHSKVVWLFWTLINDGSVMYYFQSFL